MKAKKSTNRRVRLFLIVSEILLVQLCVFGGHAFFDIWGSLLLVGVFYFIFYSPVIFSKEEVNSE